MNPFLLSGSFDNTYFMFRPNRSYLGQINLIEKYIF